MILSLVLVRIQDPGSHCEFIFPNLGIFFMGGGGDFTEPQLSHLAVLARFRNLN